MVGLNPATFGYALLIMMITSLTAVTLGLAVSSAVPTIEAANAVGPPFMIIGILFGGFYIDIGMNIKSYQFYTINHIHHNIFLVNYLIYVQYQYY